MPRFYFHLADLVEDNHGARCATRAEARVFARSLAAEYAKYRGTTANERQYICVKDETGTEVYRTPIVGTPAEIRERAATFRRD
jgi:hypothetical protein